MKILVLGAGGKIGRAIVWDLARNYKADTVGIVGRKLDILQDVSKSVGGKNIVVHQMDVTDKASAMQVMRGYDVGVSALPDRRTSYKAIEAAIESGINFVDILEEYHRRPDVEEDEDLERPADMSHEEYGDWLHQRAIENGVTVLDGFGFAPGLSNITVGNAIRKLDKVERAIARVGGIPSKEASERHPLKYMITWAFSHVLREYMINVQIIENGKPTTVPAMSAHETFRFTELGKDEQLECFITPGMPSFIYTRPNLEYFAEKTIRWSGHWQAIQTLKECGLLSMELEEFFVPRPFLSKMLTPRLMPKEGDTDACVMYNTIEGVKDGQKKCISQYLWDEGEPNGFTSMARVTGFPAAAGAVLLAQGKIKQKGVVAPEDAIEGETYQFVINELKKRRIVLVEKELPGS